MVGGTMPCRGARGHVATHVTGHVATHVTPHVAPHVAPAWTPSVQARPATGGAAVEAKSTRVGKSRLGGDNNGRDIGRGKEGARLLDREGSDHGLDAPSGAERMPRRPLPNK